MTVYNGIRLTYILIWGLSIIGFTASVIRFMRSYREEVELQFGPLPTPIAFLNLIALIILLVRIGEINADTSTGWLIVRLFGISLSIYGLIMLPWTMGVLDRFGIPGVALLRDHTLITSGPFQVVRHPGYSAFIALWLGTALSTLNWLLLALWPLVVTGAYLTSRSEEELLRAMFGKEYCDYAQDKSRFIPGIW